MFSKFYLVRVSDDFSRISVNATVSVDIPVDGIALPVLHSACMVENLPCRSQTCQ